MWVGSDVRIGPQVRTHASRLVPVEVIAQHCVHQVRLRDPELVCCPFRKFFIIIGDDNRFVFIRKSPGAHITIHFASLTRVTLHVVALFAERLPVVEIIRTVPRPRHLVVWAELYIRFLLSARSASVPMLLPYFLPFSFAEFGSRLSLGADLQALQLVTRAFLSDRSESFVSLQFAQTPEHIFVRGLAVCGAKCVYSCADICLRQYRTRYPVPCRPKRLQDNRVVKFVCRARRNESSRSISQPFRASFFRVVRSRPRCEHEPSTGTRFAHVMARL